MSKFIFLFLFCLSAYAQEATSKATSGFIDLNAYHDSREYPITTINILANINEKYQYFSLVDYFGGSDSYGRDTDTAYFYTEQNLRYFIPENKLWAASVQWAGQSGPRNDILRAGVLLQLSELLFYGGFFDGSKNYISANIFPIQVDHMSGFNWQIEYFYRFQLWPSQWADRVYLAGFADQDMDESGDVTWVTEHQLGLRVAENFFGVIDIRRNEYRETQRDGVGFGLEYIINF